MSQWWTYRLEDFLMFAPATYRRMFALYNDQVWPMQWLALPLGLWLLWLAARRPAWGARAACALLAVAWLWVAWAFHWQRYAGIHTAAPWFAALFAAQGLLLAWAVRPGSAWRWRATPRPAALAVLVFAVLLLPAAAVVQGRPWQQTALFGLTPDATALGTLAVLALLERSRSPVGAVVWLLPLLWCAASAATLWTLRAPVEASALLAACAVALIARR